MGRRISKLQPQKYHQHHKTLLESCIEPFQIAVIPNNSPNKFINTRTYKPLELCHDVHIACDEQITPWYSLRSAYLTTCMKSTRIKESKALQFKMLRALKSVSSTDSLQQRHYFVLVQSLTLPFLVSGIYFLPLSLYLSLSFCLSCKHLHSTINVGASVR